MRLAIDTFRSRIHIQREWRLHSYSSYQSVDQEIIHFQHILTHTFYFAYITIDLFFIDYWHLNMQDKHYIDGVSSKEANEETSPTVGRRLSPYFGYE